MKIQSTSDNPVRSKLSAQMVFSRDDEVEGRKDVKFLNGFPFVGSHATNGEEGDNFFFLCLCVCKVSNEAFLPPLSPRLLCLVVSISLVC